MTFINKLNRITRNMIHEPNNEITRNMFHIVPNQVSTPPQPNLLYFTTEDISIDQVYGYEILLDPVFSNSITNNWGYSLNDTITNDNKTDVSGAITWMSQIHGGEFIEASALDDSGNLVGNIVNFTFDDRRIHGIVSSDLSIDMSSSDYSNSYRMILSIQTTHIEEIQYSINGAESVSTQGMIPEYFMSNLTLPIIFQPNNETTVLQINAYDNHILKDTTSINYDFYPIQISNLTKVQDNENFTLTFDVAYNGTHQLYYQVNHTRLFYEPDNIDFSNTTNLVQIGTNTLIKYIPNNTPVNTQFIFRVYVWENNNKYFEENVISYLSLPIEITYTYVHIALLTVTVLEPFEWYNVVWTYSILIEPTIVNGTNYQYSLDDGETFTITDTNTPLIIQSSYDRLNDIIIVALNSDLTLSVKPSGDTSPKTVSQSVNLYPPPQIKFLSPYDQDIFTIERKTSFTFPTVNNGIHASHDLNISIDTTTIDLNVVGSYDVTYSSTNYLGVNTSLTKTYNIVDTVVQDFTFSHNQFNDISNELIVSNYDVEDSREVKFYYNGVLFHEHVFTNNENFYKFTKDEPINGIYTYDATINDIHGNSRTKDLTIIINDISSPIINFSDGNSSIYYLERYTTPTFPIPSVSDTTNITLDYDTSIVNMDTVGDYVVEYRATDQNGNFSIVNKTYAVTDNLEPTASPITYTVNNLTITFTIEGITEPNVTVKLYHDFDTTNALVTQILTTERQTTITHTESSYLTYSYILVLDDGSNNKQYMFNSIAFNFVATDKYYRLNFNLNAHPTNGNVYWRGTEMKLIDDSMSGNTNLIPLGFEAIGQSDLLIDGSLYKQIDNGTGTMVSIIAQSTDNSGMTTTLVIKCPPTFTPTKLVIGTTDDSQFSSTGLPKDTLTIEESVDNITFTSFGSVSFSADPMGYLQMVTFPIV